MEELGGDVGISLDLEDFRDKIGWDTAELVEVCENGRAPRAVLAEGVADVAGNGREAAGNREEGLGGGLGRVRWGWGGGVRAPALEVYKCWRGDWRDGFFRVSGLAIGEEAPADYRTVLGGLTVAVEEVEFGGFLVGLRGHFLKQVAVVDECL